MEPDKNKVCVCGIQPSKLMACSGCKNIGYCSKLCQIQGWPSHKQACKKISSSKQNKENVPENAGLCQHCGALGPVKTCKGCHTATYCGRDCQRSDWGSHKLNCRGKMSTFVSLMEGSVVPRSSGSLEKAKAIAAKAFPNDKIVDSFYDLPGEYAMQIGRNHVLVAFMFKAHVYFFRHGIYIKDKNDEQLQVMFYVDYDNPAPYFTWDDIAPGKYICIRNASIRHFMDGSTGIRIDEACDVKVINA